MKRAAVYLRVSTADQDVAAQRASCLKICAANGWEPIEVAETGSGARKLVGWDRVMAMAAGHEIVAVVVWALDRIGRSMWAISDSVREIDAAGVRLCSVQEPWLDVGEGGLGAETRPLMISLFSWVAGFERRRLVARTLEGLADARRKGRVGGPKSASLVGAHLDFAIELYKQKKSMSEIQAALFARGVYQRPRPATKDQKPKPVPRGTIWAAIMRTYEFDGVNPIEPAAELLEASPPP